MTGAKSRTERGAGSFSRKRDSDGKRASSQNSTKSKTNQSPPSVSHMSSPCKIAKSQQSQVSAASSQLRFSTPPASRQPSLSNSSQHVHNSKTVASHAVVSHPVVIQRVAFQPFNLEDQLDPVKNEEEDEDEEDEDEVDKEFGEFEPDDDPPLMQHPRHQPD